MTIQLKTCSKCKKSKSLTDFYRDSRRKDGRQSWCKACVSECNRRYNRNNPRSRAEHVREWQRKNKKRLVEYGREYRRKNRKRINEYAREYRSKNRKRMAVYWRGYKRNQIRYRAGARVQSAVKRGDLPPVTTQICFVGFEDGCTVEATEYHHIDYSQPLVVFPVCRSCHRRWHVSNDIDSMQKL